MVRGGSADASQPASSALRLGVAGAEVVVDQGGAIRQPAQGRRQGRADVAQDQVGRIGDAIGMGRGLPLEDEDLPAGMQAAQVIVGAPIAEAELQDRPGDALDPAPASRPGRPAAPPDA